jgi:hypothetical protein
MDCVVAPLDQAYVEPAEAVSVTEPGAQNVVGPEAVIVAAGFGFTVTFLAGEMNWQLASVTVTLYAPLCVTLIARVVAPFDQRYESPNIAAVSVTLPPAQKVVAPLALTVVFCGAK